MVKVGIIGAGFMGGMHAEVYKQFPDVQIAGIADTAGEKAKSLAEKTGTVPFYSVDSLLNKKDISIIDVCLPTYMHKEFVVKAAEKGKDVICEKPIALTLSDADEMINICKQNKVRFVVAHVLRFWPEYQYLKENHEKGRFGRLESITCTRLSPRPSWAWDNWLHSNERSGGALVDLHIHDVDYLLYLLGKKPESLFSRGRKINDTYEHVYTTYKFPEGVLAFAEGGWDFTANYPFMMAYTAVFEKAIVEFNSRNKPTLNVYHADGKIEQPTFTASQAQLAVGNVADLGGYYFELRYFIEHLIYNKAFQVTTPEESRQSLEIVLKEKESADSNQ